VYAIARVLWQFIVSVDVFLQALLFASLLHLLSLQQSLFFLNCGSPSPPVFDPTQLVQLETRRQIVTLSSPPTALCHPFYWLFENALLRCFKEHH
jgi:hypothetical protein